MATNHQENPRKIIFPLQGWLACYIGPGAFITFLTWCMKGQ